MKLLFNFGYIAAEAQWIKYIDEYTKNGKRDPHNELEYLLDDMDQVNMDEDYRLFTEKTAQDLGLKKL